MMLLQTILAFLVVVGVLVIVHELGHYLAARWCGVKVLRFSVGMGKIVFSRRFGRDQTEWAISALPLGGYVKMLDGRETDLTGLPPEELAREFTRQSVWRRIVIVAAGPLANFLLAIAVFAGLYSYGIPEPLPKLRAPAADTAAHRAGLRGGETVTAINGKPVASWSDMHWAILELAVDRNPARLDVEKPAGEGQSAGKLLDTVTLSLEALSTSDLEGDFLGRLGVDLARPPAVLGRIVPGGAAERAGLKTGDRVSEANGMALRDGLELGERIRASPGQRMTLAGTRADGSAFLLAVTPAEEAGGDGKRIGRIHAEVPLAPELIIASAPPLRALVKGVAKTWETSVLTLKMIGKMIVGEISWKNITGPITIADYAGQTARIGLVSYLTFIAFISISLGIMNLLPIPVLDGGHLLYYALEVLTGRPVSGRVAEIAQRAGFGILIALMVVATFNDIERKIAQWFS
jgi:regulator of sigma E protease